MTFNNYVTTRADNLGIGDITDTGKHFWYVDSVYRCFGGIYVTFKDARGDVRKELFNHTTLVRKRVQPTPVITTLGSV